MCCQAIGQQAEGSVTLWAIPASDAGPTRSLARVGTVSCERASAVRMVRTTFQPCIAPRPHVNILLAGKPRWIAKLHRPGGSPEMFRTGRTLVGQRPRLRPYRGPAKRSRSRQLSPNCKDSGQFSLPNDKRAKRALTEMPGFTARRERPRKPSRFRRRARWRSTPPHGGPEGTANRDATLLRFRQNIGWSRFWCCRRQLKRLGPVHQRLDPIGDFLRRLAKLSDGPVGGIASVTSLGRAWLTSRLVSDGGSISSRSATVMKQLRRPWNQNLAPPVSLMRP